MNQPPFRMPCEAVHGAPRFFFGSPFQHATAPLLYDKYTNSTQVTNWNTAPGQPATTDVYERWTPDDSGGDSCEVHHCVDGGAPCSQWLRPFAANTFAHTPGDQVNFAVTHKRGFKNVQARRFWSGRFGYKHIEDGADTTECCDSNTLKTWLSYQSEIADTKYTVLAITGSWENTTYDYSSGSQVPTTVSDSMGVTQSIDPNSGLTTFSSFSGGSSAGKALAQIYRAFWKWNDIVNAFTNLSISGTLTFDCTASGGSGTRNSYANFGSGPLPVESLSWNFSTGSFSRQEYEYDDGTMATQRVILNETATVTDSSFSYTSIGQTFGEVTFGGSHIDILSKTTITVSGTFGGSNTSAAIYADIKNNLLSLWPLNDDALYPWRIDQKVSVAPLVSRDEIFTSDFTQAFWIKDYSSPIANASGSPGDPAWDGECNTTLCLDPNTGSTKIVLQGRNSAGDILSTGANGSGLGFTTITGYTYVGLLPSGCTFNTTTGILSGTVSADCTWGITVTINGATSAATGAILGAPKPAGYQNYFDFNYRDWAGCCFHPPDNPGFQTWSWYQVGWGMDVGTFNSNAGCSLPLNATQWTNYFQAVNKPQGAYLFYNEPGQAFYGAGCVSSDAPSGVLDGDALWACKYAEILEQWNSQNFARPAGDDKFLIDENRVYCVTNVSRSGEGSTWTITDPTSGLSPADGTDFTGIWGASSVGGFYNIAGYGGGVMTLGSKIYDVPSNWASKSNNDGNICFGKLRFPTAPALLGRVAVTPDVAGTSFAFANAQPAFGMNSSAHQERIDLWDKNMAQIASGVTATRIDDSHFSLPTSYLSVFYITVTSTAAWYINDTAPKGDYAVLEWLSDFRSLGEYNRLQGILDCSSTQVSQPSTNVGGGPVTQSFASFTQTPGCLPFVPCAPKVVCFSPNGEIFPNGKTWDFPAEFPCDEKYGSKWWGYVQSTMTDLFWQQPHRPCNIEPCALWQMDDLTCESDKALDCPVYCCSGDDDYTGDSVPPVYYFGQPPLVEARLTVPCNYGAAQDECAPALPTGIQIGWTSPVNNTTGDIALPPIPPGAENANGRPAGATTAWNIHTAICAATGCRFGYSAPGC